MTDRRDAVIPLRFQTNRYVQKLGCLADAIVEAAPEEFQKSLMTSIVDNSNS